VEGRRARALARRRGWRLLDGSIYRRRRVLRTVPSAVFAGHDY
jgi:hypothetical protein